MTVNKPTIVEKMAKRIKIKETNDIFKSISECSRMSKELYGVNFDRTRISNAIKNKKTYKGYTFEQI